MNQSKYLYNTFIIILFINKIRVGKTCLTKMISNNTFEESYRQTIIISIANKTAILTDNSKIQLKLIDSPGNLDFKNLNTISKILNKLKALLYMKRSVVILPKRGLFLLMVYVFKLFTFFWVFFLLILIDI